MVKKLLFLIAVCLFIIGCQVEKIQPEITEKPTAQETIPETPQESGQIAPEEPETVQETKPKKVTNIKLPPAPTSDNFCNLDDSYDGYSAEGIVGADIIGIVTFKNDQYCKASAKWEEDNINYEYIYYFQVGNKDVWLEQIIDGKKQLIHIMENNEPLI